MEKEQAKCRKRVKSLVKRQKMSEAQKLVQQELELEEWGTEAQVKVRFLYSANRNTSLVTHILNF